MFYFCRCFMTYNYFSHTLKRHFYFESEGQLLRDYEAVFTDIPNEEVSKVLTELQTEQKRRFQLEDDSMRRQKVIQENYKPLNPHVYTLEESFFATEFLKIVNYCKSASASRDLLEAMMTRHKAERVYSFPVFTKTFCSDFLDELDYFKKSGLEIGKPNTMNNYGILLNELGFDEKFISLLRRDYLSPVCRLLFPDWGGHCLDSHKAFTVHYQTDGDVALHEHFDNAEVTINVCLGRDFDDGTLYFSSMRTKAPPKVPTEITQQVTVGVLHRGQHRHGAMPVQGGERINLIIWMRSSLIRNKLCPMCDNEPELLKAQGFGDGFTAKSVDVCKLT